MSDTTHGLEEIEHLFVIWWNQGDRIGYVFGKDAELLGEIRGEACMVDEYGRSYLTIDHKWLRENTFKGDKHGMQRYTKYGIATVMM